MFKGNEESNKNKCKMIIQSRSLYPKEKIFKGEFGWPKWRKV